MRLAFSRKRKVEGLSYDVVAERSGIARRTVQRLENGEREGQLRTWFHLANAVDLSFEDLVRHLYEGDPADAIAPHAHE
ncbi:helix-turn-helix transcriptional regulator [Frigoribacterium sp. PhB118]|uniref:helix-turn-helix transcriptional regulator n=1 Tax=Frigoribacterium sp. PhB118 TaxID=2485175 RepID=UPI000F4A40C9|nr:helix-turn-helix protein [Frigoribacterium sp. PhB118]